MDLIVDDPNRDHTILGFYYQAFIYVSLEDIKQINNISFFSHSIKISSLKKTKNPRIIKITRELKNLEDAIEEINKIEELETEMIIESTKRKLSAIEKEKLIRINELEENLRIKTVKKRMKERPMSLKKQQQEK